MVHELGKENSIFNQFIMELRSEEVQNDRMRFRRNMERIGEIFAYELSKKLDYRTADVTTPLGSAVMQLPVDFPLLATILRAGLPLHQGLLNYFDKSDSAFVSAYRKHAKNEDDFQVKIEYLSSPEITGKQVVISDPMLASGSSMILVYNALKTLGTPAHLHIVTVLSSVEGLAAVKKNLPKNTTFWIGAIDDELTAQAYIVPGLGDAGDLSYGTKI